MSNHSSHSHYGSAYGPPSYDRCGDIDKNCSPYQNSCNSTACGPMREGMREGMRAPCNDSGRLDNYNTYNLGNYMPYSGEKAQAGRRGGVTLGKYGMGDGCCNDMDLQSGFPAISGVSQMSGIPITVNGTADRNAMVGSVDALTKQGKNPRYKSQCTSTTTQYGSEMYSGLNTGRYDG